MVVFSGHLPKHIQSGCLIAALFLATGAARAASEKVLYSFTSGNDGAFPLASLINVGGTLYGTTLTEGGPNCYLACGTVFKVTRAGAETVAHSFTLVSGGYGPRSGLTYVDGTLYGTVTEGGVTGGGGTVFTLTTAGAENTLYSFKGGSDGDYPESDLINVGGVLYGTTYGGGTSGAGTVYKLTTAGAENVIYSFKGGSDGYRPVGGLINVGGVLYGTTYEGGTSGAGTVFKVTMTGAEKVIHSFEGGNDGATPLASLINFGGALYGMTQYGGGASNLGTVFKVTTAGAETVVYAFKGGSDGSTPGSANLINVGGELYGTTTGGGTSGDGTVFKVTKTGTETVVYSFKGGSDGREPDGGLIDVGGKLYGTTEFGGTSANCNKNGGGCGTVFEVTP